MYDDYAYGDDEGFDTVYEEMDEPLQGDEALIQEAEVAGLTPPYGTRREPVQSPMTQDRANANDFINRMNRDQYLRQVPPVMRDIEEQGDMMSGAGLRPREIMQRLDEQYGVKPRQNIYIDPEDEEEVYYGRRFG